jgi:hypothetical protein
MRGNLLQDMCHLVDVRLGLSARYNSRTLDFSRLVTIADLRAWKHCVQEWIPVLCERNALDDVDRKRRKYSMPDLTDTRQ